MDIKELKENILNNNLSSSLLILNYSESTFLPNQYIKEISKVKKKEIIYINSLDELENFSKINLEDNYIYVLYLDELNDDFKLFANNINNLIVVCKKIDTSLYSDNVVKMPKLEEWQIKNYIMNKLPGLEERDVDWLYQIFKGDIYRLDQESDKLKLFSKSNQKLVFDQLIEEGNYKDVYNFNIFDLVSAISKKNLDVLKDTWSKLNYSDTSILQILALLQTNFKNIISIQMQPNATAESLNMNPKQFAAIKYSCGYYKSDELIEIYDTITSLDYKLKAGILSQDQLGDYLIAHLPIYKLYEF